MSSETEQRRESPLDPSSNPGSSAREVQPPQSGGSFRRRNFSRWLLLGGIRILYRTWTRIAARVFPEDSRQAAIAMKMGIPLPDRLNMSWVTPHLAVGGRVLPEDIHRLSTAGVTRVVDTRSEHQDDAEMMAGEGIELLYLPAPDTFPLTVPQLRMGAAWVNQQISQGQRVLIHCEHGVGRSVLLTASSLVAMGMSVHQAMDLIQAKRWQAAPNHRQIRRLQEFEQSIRAHPLSLGAE